MFQSLEDSIYRYSLGMNTIAIRIPNHKLLLDIFDIIRVPVFVTSANISGTNVATNIDDLITTFKDKVDFIVNDNNSYSNIPSTIVDVTGNEISIIREGIIRSEDIFKALL